MITRTSTVLALLATITVASGCAAPAVGPPVAERPSLTVYPVQMAGTPHEDVAAVVALMLEQRGMTSIEVDDAVFTPDVGASFEETADAFGRFVADRDLTTEYALYGAVVGTPPTGVDEIHGVLVDRSGLVAWSDCQTRTSPAMQRAKPENPMTAMLFLVDRLRGPLVLLNAKEDDNGRWARHWRNDSLQPSEAEIDAMEARQKRLATTASSATVLVYPARTGDAWSADCAERLAAEINRRGWLSARVAVDPIPFEIQPARNQQRVLWSGAHSIRELVRVDPPEADYVLVADYVPGGYVHTFMLDRRGDWVIVDFQNSHHDDFNRVKPTSLERCCDLSVRRLARDLAS